MHKYTNGDTAMIDKYNTDIRCSFEEKLDELRAKGRLSFNSAFNQANEIASDVSVVIKRAKKSKDFEQVRFFAELAAEAYSLAAEKVKSKDRDRIRLAGSFWSMQADCANIEAAIVKASEAAIVQASKRETKNRTLHYTAVSKNRSSFPYGRALNKIKVNNSKSRRATLKNRMALKANVTDSC